MRNTVSRGIGLMGGVGKTGGEIFLTNSQRALVLSLIEGIVDGTYITYRTSRMLFYLDSRACYLYIQYIYIHI